MKKQLFKTASTILSISILLFASGCMWGRVKVNDSSIVQRATRIKPGQTMLSQIPSILGAQPNIRIPGKDKTLFGYTFSDTKNHGLMLIFVNFTRSTTISQTLYIEGDSHSGLVSAVHYPKPQNIQWQYWPFDGE